MDQVCAAILARIPHLACEYDLARDTASRARIELRECERLLQTVECERGNLQVMLEFYRDSPNTRFDDRDTLSVAAASLRTLKGGVK